MQTFLLEETGYGVASKDGKVLYHCSRESMSGALPRWDTWTPLYRRVDDPMMKEMTWDNAPEGATRLDGPRDSCFAGPDGKDYIVKCPGGRTWHVDGPCSNCTRKDEKHYCWIRHGDPVKCNVTVDKQGDTCSAGAGSIQTGNWHGFLTNGILSENR